MCNPACRCGKCDPSNSHPLHPQPPPTPCAPLVSRAQSLDRAPPPRQGGHTAVPPRRRPCGLQVSCHAAEVLEKAGDELLRGCIAGRQGPQQLAGQPVFIAGEFVVISSLLQLCGTPESPSWP